MPHKSIHKEKNKIQAEYIFLTIIILAGLVLRLYRIQVTPPGLHIDEAINGLCALDILEGRERPIYFNRLWGLDVMHPYLSALVFALFNPSIISMRIVTALAGTLTIVGVFLLARLLFDSASGVFAALLLAISRWHIHFSRIGCHWILPPLFIVFSLYWFIKGFKTKRPVDFIFAGIFFGFGFYTYLPFRMAVFLIFFFLLYKIVEDKSFLKRYDRLLIIFFVSAIVTSLPLWVYASLHSDVFFRRANTVAVNSLVEILSNAVRVILMFGFRGDGWPANNIPGKPMLFLPVFLLFAGGLALSAKAYLANCSRDSHMLVIIWLVIMCLPSVFSSGAPHALRTIGAVPAVYIISALSLVYIYTAIIKVDRRLCFAVFAVFIGIVSIANVHAYFVAWPRLQEVKEIFCVSNVSLMKQIQKSYIRYNVFLTMPMYTYAPNTFLIRKDKSDIYCIYNSESFMFPAGSEKDIVYCLGVDDEQHGITTFLKTIYPQAEKIGDITISGDKESIKLLEIFGVRREFLKPAVPPEIHEVAASAFRQIQEKCLSTPWLKDQVSFAEEKAVLETHEQ